MNRSVIGIDLAKNSFSVCSLNQRGKVLFSKTFSRHRLSVFLKTTEKTFVAMEACGGAHHWARMAKEAGHEVKMMNPKFVKPFVKSNKNDDADAQAIAEAAIRESIPRVPVKEMWQQDILVLHRVKERLTKNKVALSNEIRGFLLEFGITIPIGTASFRKKISQILGDDSENLSQMFKDELQELVDEFDSMLDRLAQAKTKIKTVSKTNEVCQKLEKVPGVGPMISTALVAAVGDATNYKNGRHMAAWIGLVPRHSGTGGKNRISGISKRGDRYLRCLLIQGAQTVINWAGRDDNPQRNWINKKLSSKERNKVAVAVANKNARILWKLLATDAEFDQSLAYAV